MLSQKLLVDFGIDMFAGENQTIGSLNRQDLPLIPLAALLLAPSMKHQVHASVYKLSHIENHVFAVAEVLANLHMVLSCAEL
jgi:hypothetical protein